MERLPSSSHQFKYDVFLSFGGQGARTSFVDHLYTALAQNGIRTFKDDDDKEESEAASTAIEESRCGIVIFSKSYGSWAWCLDQLVKIMKFNKEIGHLLLPVFYYDINPSDLRRPESVFAALFAKYEMEKVRAWTAALVEASHLSGQNLIDDRCEARCIEEIVNTVSRKLGINISGFHQNMTEMKHEKLGGIASNQEILIGIEHRMQEVKSLLEVETVKNESKSALASPSPQSFRWTYDVFMSFIGNDCGEFAKQLYRVLVQRRINTFIDDLALDDLVSQVLLKDIEESTVAVVIFSKHYAASSRCLDKLVKIMNYNEGIGQIVLPVYYDVDPSDVRNQKGFFGKAFMQHDSNKVEIWRKSLVDAGSLAGWYLNDTNKSHEATTIENIVDKISSRLARLPLYVDDNLIGIKHRMKHVISLLELESGGVRMLGICGMGGAGKTTLARAVFDNVSNYFDGSCFVENIREVSTMFGLEMVQKEVLSKLSMKDDLHVNSVCEGTILTRNLVRDHKFLIVLDDVDCISQVDALAGAYNWFGEGSRIMITTRDENVLAAHNTMQTYCLNELNDDESVQFLRRHAFNNKDDITKEYEDLLLQVVHYAAGLPLALKVLSSLLCGKSKDEWTSTLARLERVPEKKIEEVLKISYDGLDDDVKNIFLLLACFFDAEKKYRVVRILDSCGFYAADGIRLLQQKHLIRILGECIDMHPLLQQMGRDIDRQVHPDEPGKRSRLWHAEDVSDVLMQKAGTKEVIAIFVGDLHHQHSIDMTEAFKGMENLKLLQVDSCNEIRLQGSSYLPDELRWLTWKKYPLRSLPASFIANNLVGLELVGSHIEELWTGIKYIGTLRFLDLSGSWCLIRTPDFTGTPNLEKLQLDRCWRLKIVHESIGSLNRLSFLSLQHCRELLRLPQSILELESLKSLDLDECGLSNFPSQMGLNPRLENTVLVDVDLVRDWWMKRQESVFNHETP